MNSLLKKISINIPEKPGIYKMLDKDDKIIYIGKAKNLKKRVKSYLNKTIQASEKTKKMLESVKSINFVLVLSELEAIMLETNLIKEFRPKYNILMKDDKNFVYLKISIKDDYPKIGVTRKILKDKARYFGPKTSADQLYKTLKTLRKIFPYRNCQLIIEDKNKNHENKREVKVKRANIKYPCLDLHIKLCQAPCIGNISPDKYKENINEIIDFFDGKTEKVINKLKKGMYEFAQKKEFEKAAKIRDKIEILNKLSEKQSITSPKGKSIDIIGVYQYADKAYFSVLKFRDGKMYDPQNTILEINSDVDNEEIHSAYIKQKYIDSIDPPSKIFMEGNIKERENLEKILTEIHCKKITIRTGDNSKKAKLYKIALENAKSFYKQTMIKWENEKIISSEDSLMEMAKILNMSKKPSRIECYDISHLSGTGTVASMVVMEKGIIKKEDYRHFKINMENPGKPNDFAALQEVLSRRIKHLNANIKNDKYKISISKERIGITFENEKISLPIILKNKTKTILFWKKENFMDEKEILSRIIQKIKTKRLYFLIQKSKTELFQSLGFETLRCLPKEIKLKKNQTALVLDKNKIKKDSSMNKIPDIIIIDGGKGQLSSCYKILENAEINIKIISIAKKNEEIFTPKVKKAIILPNDSLAKKMITVLRDEAHRFAIEYQRKLRKKDLNYSVLEEIPGIGKNTSKKLLKRFGSAENIKSISEDEVAEIIGDKKAIIIKTNLTE